MATHTWKSGTAGFIYEPSFYQDGTAFAPGDTLAVNNGTLVGVSTVAGVSSLTPGTYRFDATGATAGLRFTNVAFDPNTTLSVVGPQTLFWTGTGQFANNGLIQVGSATASGSVDYTIFEGSTPDGSFTNNGVMTLQNGSLFKFEPLSSSNGTFLNAAGAVLRIGAGSAFAGLGPTDVGRSTVFQNNGLVELDGAAGRVTTFNAPIPLSVTGGVQYQGTGVLTVQGAPGDAPSDTVAVIGSGGGLFNVSSGQVQFDSFASTPPSRTISFLDNNGQVLDNVFDSSVPITQPASSVKPMNATVSGFVAGDAITYQVYYSALGTRAAPTYSYNPATHQLAVAIEPGQVSTLTLNGNYTQADFQLTPLSISNTVTLTTTSTANALTSVPALVAADLPASAYSAASIAAASKGLSALSGAGGARPSISAGGPFAAAASGVLNIAVAAAPAAGSSLALPSGYGGLIAQGSSAVTLSDAGAAGAVLVGNGAGDTFNSSGTGAMLVGGQGANTFNVSGSATVATGDGPSTVRGSGQAALAVTTGAGGSTVVLAGGASTVQSNGQDTVFGGAGASTVTATKGLVAVGGAGKMTFIGGSATSLVFGGQGGVSYTAGSAYDIVVGGGGPLNVQAGAGGGQFWGNAGGDVLSASGGAAAVLVANNGGQLSSAGPAGNFLVAGAGTAVLDGSKATGNDVFFGGTGKDTIILGSGTDLVGTGTGTSTVQLGSGQDTVFAFGTSTVTSGSGSANVVMGGTVTLNVAQAAAGAAARSFALFNFVPGTDKISLSGYGSGTAANAIATQANGSGQTVLTLGDQTRIQLVGVTRADAGFFA